ncbi:MAG: NTPase [Nitrososphaeria archaeon]|nr:NTPase [Conexivisphaerales archaeon]
MASVYVITGPPGIGKTTALVKLVKMLRNAGVEVDGFYSVEVKEKGERKGFSFVDVVTGETAELASLSGDGIRFGRYRVKVKNIDEFVPRVIHRAAEYAEVIVIDEIGPMELFSGSFRKAVEELLKTDKAVIAVVHRSFSHDLMKEILKSAKATVEVTESNRDSVPEQLYEMLKSDRILK